MRKLKLQMHISLDGYVAGPNGESDWMTFSDDGFEYVNALIDTSDTLLLGRKMSDGFMDYWESVAKQPENPKNSFAIKIVNIPKIVFSKTIEESKWGNTTLAKGDIVEEVEKIKKKDGKDIIVYGGANFVSNLIRENLIDEYHLNVNPTAIGSGLAIFNNLKDGLQLQLIKSQALDSGVVVNTYLAK